MKFASYHKVLPVLTLLSVFSHASASDLDDLNAMLLEFLGAADKEAAHARFWAEDLVYTSSDGTRKTKAEIMAAFAEVEVSDAPPATLYSAQDVDIRIYDTSAVIAFRLVGTPSDGSDVLNYLNTGTFLKRDGVWEVVAWHATKIPPVSDSGD